MKDIIHIKSQTSQEKFCTPCK